MSLTSNSFIHQYTRLLQLRSETGIHNAVLSAAERLGGTGDSIARDWRQVLRLLQKEETIAEISGILALSSLRTFVVASGTDCSSLASALAENQRRKPLVP